MLSLEISFSHLAERNIILKKEISNKKKTSAIWKGIRSLVTIKLSNLNVITIIDKNVSLVTDPIIIANSFNEYFANVGPSIENKISVNQYIYPEYLKDVRINHSFYRKPATYDEVAEIIQPLDINKSLGPNSLPVYISKICEDFLSTCLLEINYHLGQEFFLIYVR